MHISERNPVGNFIKRFTFAMPTTAPLRLHTRALSCGTLYAGQSFMAKQQEVKLEQPRENIEEELRVSHMH